MKRHPGVAVTWVVVLLPVLLWIVLVLPEAPFGQQRSLFRHLGRVTGLVGMAMLSTSFILAARMQALENYFGGLDKMYRLHHQLGVWATALLVAHPIALALRFVPDRMERALLFLLPLHDQTAVNLGVYTFWLFVVLMALTLLIRLPYDRWKVSHTFLGLVLVGGTIHMLTAVTGPEHEVMLAQHPVLLAYMTGLAGLGIASYGYKTAILPLRARKHRYEVNTVRRLNEEIVEIDLVPRTQPLEYRVGQFAFATFYDDRVPRESHPFTLCSVPADRTIKLTVKAVGDFTRLLYRTLHPGMAVRLDGPYGRFDYRTGARRQVWIAGGVGVAPFLGWARDLRRKKDTTYDVHFYYCVHSRGDAVYREEFETISRQLPSLHVQLICSVERGHLKATEIEDLNGRDVFMCGPQRLTSDMRRQLHALDVPDRRIHFEDFEFHTSL